MKIAFLTLCCFSSSLFLYAQDGLRLEHDSTKLLREVIIHGYSNDRALKEIPAAIGLVATKDIDRFNNTSILQAVNTIPGVRMEERSPGSYRFAIRGSSLRSPFGVRNVKMYWNGLPLTDGSGNTYLNLIDISAISTAEVIKGPGASLYGAGTGGVVLLKSPMADKKQIQLSSTGGSYGLQRYQVSAVAVSRRSKLSLNYAHQQSNGYRQQTKLNKNAINADLRFQIDQKSTLAATLFYTDLTYQTPGGLTKTQYQANPKQARPDGATPGAVAQQAAIYNKTFYGGVMYDHRWNDRWSTQSGVYGSVTDFTNPALRNYELRSEYNVGGRTETQYRIERDHWKGKMTGGAEYQHFYSTLTDYGNRLGVRDTLQSSDRLYSSQGLLFVQGEFDLPSDFFLTVGGSGNFLNDRFIRLSPSSVEQHRDFNPVFSPRVALLKKLNENSSVYGNVSNGFSPPSFAEVRPSTGNFNSGLKAERGISYEIGFRGSAWNRLSYDFAVYDFELNHTIVVQQLDGADYFINAGNTRQQGLESKLSWAVFESDLRAIKVLRLWTTYTFNHYRFLSYRENGQDYSHHRLTGVAPNLLVSGLDVQMKRLYANVTVNYVDKIPLNDASTDFSSAYLLAGAKLGYRNPQSEKIPVDIFVGIENATNRTYSLGNDLNATGGRYYNAAAGRNFYFGMKVIIR